MKKLSMCVLFIAAAIISVVATGCNKESKYTPKPNQQKPIEYNDEGVDKTVFELIDLDKPEMENVKRLYNEEKHYLAAKELLNYYRLRTGVTHTLVSLVNVVPTNDDKKWADYSLKYQFMSTKTLDPPLNYMINGAIDWAYWPVKDNEIRYQVHRHQWFVPLAKMYRGSYDEKWIKAWQEHYGDWLKQNPIPPVKLEYGDPSKYPDYVNERFAWRPLEVAHRVLAQTELMYYFMNSINFTPEWLSTFLVHFHSQVNHVVDNYTADGNHLITQAQAVTFAGVLFSEFKDAGTWVASGSGKLNSEIDRQFYQDGMLKELDLSYHIGAIADFYTAMDLAYANGTTGLFPANYVESMRKMTDVVMNMTYPDYSVPQFNDTRKSSYSKSVLTRNFKTYARIFPDNTDMKWMAYDGAQGTQPKHLMQALENSGYYIMKNGWTKSSTMMVLQNGPVGEYHSQPDNGTFEIYVNGRNFFTDSGVYKYSGDAQTNAERNWFRQTRVHNTMTLDYKNITGRDGKLRQFKADGNNIVLVTENQAYSTLKHRRAVFFVDKQFFVFVDEGIGTATGSVNLNFNMLGAAEIKTGATYNAVLDLTDNGAHTVFSDNNNIVVRTFSSEPLSSEAFAGRVSEVIDNYVERNGCWSVNISKTADKTARFITVVLPIMGNATSSIVSAQFTDSGYTPGGASVSVTVNGKVYNLQYAL